MVKFSRWELRTTDAIAARAFYSKIFGHDRAVIWPLHEQALARGARPHWIGYLGVPDVELAIAAFTERGATRLGPAPPAAAGGQGSVIRDPGGAILALSTPPPPDAKPGASAVWQVLNTNDAAQAMANYRELFGWAFEAQPRVSPHGTLYPFAWQTGGEHVGGVTDITGMPGRHAHWLFFSKVDALEPAMDATRAAGGLVLDPITLPSGERVCVCDDPQGAAFGLVERPR